MLKGRNSSDVFKEISSLLFTNLIPSRKERVLDDIRTEEEMRYLQTFQIKGKQLPIKSTSGMNLSASLQQPEAIPTKATEAYRLRESVGKKKRRDEEIRNKFEEKFQRSRSAKERRLREGIYERAKLQDKSKIYKAKKDESVNRIFQFIYFEIKNGVKDLFFSQIYLKFNYLFIQHIMNIYI